MNNYNCVYMCLYTLAYKESFIHARYNLVTKKEEFTIQGWPNVILPSIKSAKCRITKIIGR